MYSLDATTVVVVAIASFFMGAAVCSAESCYHYRKLRKQSWSTGRSKCEGCGRVLRWYEVIPVLGYLIVRGRCKSCGHVVRYAHAIIELTCGLLTVSSFLQSIYIGEYFPLLGIPVVFVTFYHITGIYNYIIDNE